MENPIERMRQAKEAMADVKSEALQERTMLLNADGNRLDYFDTETNSLMAVLDLLEKERYKECFILLRTVLEKFPYFWLMMDGRKYRHRKEWRIQPRESKKPKEARDKTYQLWLKMKEEGHPNLQNAKKIEKGSADDVISVLYEEEGLFLEGSKKELIPRYVFVLDEYEPNIKHLSKLPTIKEGTVFPAKTNLQKTQDMIYHYFIFVNSMLDNLVLNGLISTEQKDRVMVHYNFLSSFTHPSRNNIRLWQSTGRGTIGRYDYYEPIVKHLIILYTAKLMHLYIRELVHGYRRDYNVLNNAKYDKVIEEMGSLSKDLWFIDDEPHSYDVWWSDVRKRAAQHRGKKIENSGVLYYEDPYQRQKEIWKRDYPESIYYIH